MGKIFCLLGKSAVGKDTIFKKIMEEDLNLKTIIPYTTRPKRSGETNGVEYYFTDEAGLAKLEDEGRVIEKRVYNTVMGPWAFFTVDDGRIDLENNDYIMIATPKAVIDLIKYFGKEVIVPIYIYLPDGVLLERALTRENSQKTPNYAEMCRRYLADLEDYTEDILKAAGIERYFENKSADNTVKEIKAYIAEVRE